MLRDIEGLGRFAMDWLVLRGSDGVAAIFGYLYKVRACLPGPAGDAPAFGCLACSARDRSGLGGFGGVSSGLARVNQTERVLTSTSRFWINALGLIGFVESFGQCTHPCSPPAFWGLADEFPSWGLAILC